MAHARSTIRQAIVDALKAAGTAAGTRVYTEERIVAIAESDLPAIRVAFIDELQQVGSLGGGLASRMLEREVIVTVTYIIKRVSGYLDDADTACAQIEIAMANASDATIKDVIPQRVQFDLDVEGNTPFYTAAMTFAVQYKTTQGDPAQPR